MSSSSSTPRDPSSSSPSSSSAPIDAQPLPREPRRKPPPRGSASTFPTLCYTPSPDGVDSNLLILLHGLGDTSAKFHSLGTTLQRTLPQTAVLTLQGTTRVPILPEEACTYWEVITPLGEMKPEEHQDPRVFLEKFQEFVQREVVERCGWALGHVHVLGFAHGGTAAVEGVIRASAEVAKAKAKAATSTSAAPTFGSVVSICGSLLSFPTLKSQPLTTPLLLFHRTPNATTEHPLHARFKRAFGDKNITTVHKPPPVRSAASPSPERMPAGSEWDEIMRFWSQRAHWRNRNKWEIDAAEGSASGGDGEVFTIG